MLTEAGARGVNSYGHARDVALQLPHVIFQLKRKGYVVTTRRNPNASVDYILVHTPDSLKRTFAPPSRTGEPEESPLTDAELEEKLAELREKWRAQPENREIIERQAKIYKDIIQKRQQTPTQMSAL